MGGAKRYPSTLAPELMGIASLHPSYEFCYVTMILMLRHHAPFGDDGFAHLSGILRTGDFVNLDGNFLADEILQLRGLGVAAGDELERLGSRFEIAQPVRRRQPARFAGDLVGRDAFGLLAALH